jgi:hypothetical protein
MIVGQGARQLAAGMAVGLTLGFLVAGAIQHILFEVDAQRRETVEDDRGAPRT